MNLGTGETKKVIALAVLGVAAAYMVYTNLIAGPSLPPAASTPKSSALPAPAIAVPQAAPDSAPAPQRARSARGRNDEFHPILRSKRLDERIDPTNVDPTLRLDLLAHVQSAAVSGGNRNLFQFSTPPPKEVPKPTGPEPVVFVGPIKPPPLPPPPPPTPPPPITIKFYGYSTAATGKKTAYFLDGEDILVGREGDTLKRRYKVVRIMPTSVMIEDTDAKRQQSVPLTEEAQS
jgi:hypothetical protein